jgi:hypothetical protein
MQQHEQLQCVSIPLALQQQQQQPAKGAAAAAAVQQQQQARLPLLQQLRLQTS